MDNINGWMKYGRDALKNKNIAEEMKETWLIVEIKTYNLKNGSKVYRLTNNELPHNVQRDL